jgi:hypothetical protein
MKTTNNDAPGAGRDGRIKAALADYPHVDAETLAELIHWFRKEASALDVGMIASDLRLSESYRRFKSDHPDRLKGADLFWVAVFVMAVGACILLLIWSAL